MKHTRFFAAIYLRLSRDDRDVGDVMDKGGNVKLESNSISNQREMVRAFIQGQQDIELYDIYIDDGFSGSNFERPEFKRMIRDIEAGRVNCVVVKDLSRFGRDYIETGRYIQKIFPSLGVRFIALADYYDSYKADSGESGIVLPMKNFINDFYCRDISTKVKSQFEVKRKNGQCIAPFAPYGYRKVESNKNQLVIDVYAAEIVRQIFAWKIEGLAVSAIAEKLNNLGILAPKEYKKSIGVNYKGGFAGAEKAQWSSSSVKRILTNEIYLGHLVQGKTEKINYKLKKIVEKPKEEWIKVENTHEAIISQATYQIVQNLLKADGRVSVGTGERSFFNGILFCGDCGEQMIRRINRYKDTQKIYYICSTYNRGEGCTRHSIEKEKLKGLVDETIRSYVNSFMDEKHVINKAMEIKKDGKESSYYDAEIARLKQECDKYEYLCSGLYEDYKQGVITREEYQRLYDVFKQRAREAVTAQKEQEDRKQELLRDSTCSVKGMQSMKECSQLKEIDRHTLCTMVKNISVFEDQRIEVEFYFSDPYCIVRVQEENRS